MFGDFFWFAGELFWDAIFGIFGFLISLIENI